MKHARGHLFLGCRNKNIYPVDLANLQTLAPLEPPHFEAITSLAVLNDATLISGSRDKNLRLYALRKPFDHQSSIVPAHADQVNTMATDGFGSTLFTGSKDGVV